MGSCSYLKNNVGGVEKEKNYSNSWKSGEKYINISAVNTYREALKIPLNCFLEIDMSKLHNLINI